MWQAHLGEVLAILKAALPPEDFKRLVLDQPWPGPERIDPGTDQDL